MEISIKEDDLIVTRLIDEDASCVEAIEAALDVISRIYPGVDLEEVLKQVDVDSRCVREREG
jgi:hypothetical protein